MQTGTPPRDSQPLDPCGALNRKRRLRPKEPALLMTWACLRSCVRAKQPASHVAVAMKSTPSFAMPSISPNSPSIPEVSRRRFMQSLAIAGAGLAGGVSALAAAETASVSRRPASGLNSDSTTFRSGRWAGRRGAFWTMRRHSRWIRSSSPTSRSTKAWTTAT
jgi:hypothetical protein